MNVWVLAMWLCVCQFEFAIVKIVELAWIHQISVIEVKLCLFWVLSNWIGNRYLIGTRSQKSFFYSYKVFLDKPPLVQTCYIKLKNNFLINDYSISTFGTTYKSIVKYNDKSKSKIFWPRISREKYLHHNCLQSFGCIEDLEEEKITS